MKTKEQLIRSAKLYSRLGGLSFYAVIAIVVALVVLLVAHREQQDVSMRYLVCLGLSSLIMARVSSLLIGRSIRDALEARSRD